jgi:NAD(P)-dependent dehydrogenase (short-subunit alcohol dehydrogenase family)
MESFAGLTAVVTGAASGIGLELTRGLLAEGARVVMADVEAPALEAAAAEVGALGEVLAVPLDVRDPEALEALAVLTEERFGTAQLVFPNAGISVSGALWEMTVDDWSWVLGVNVHGVANTIRAFVPRLLDAGLPGHVCITGSLAGYLNQPGYGAYNASKHAVIAIAETLAGDLREAGHPIGVTVLAPWFVTTRLAQSARNRPADLADATPPGDLMRAVGARLAGVKGTAQDAPTVAALALDAVKQGRFAVFPFEPSKPAIRERFETVLDGGVMGFFLPG